MLALLIPGVASLAAYLLWRQHEGQQTVPPAPPLPMTVEASVKPTPPVTPWVPIGPPLDKDIPANVRDAVWIVLARDTNPGEVAAFAELLDPAYPVAYKLLSAKTAAVVGVQNSPDYQKELSAQEAGTEPPFGMPNSNAYAGQNMIVYTNANLTGASAKIQPGIGPFKILSTPTMVGNKPVVRVMVQWVPGAAMKQGYAALSDLTPWAWPYSGTTAYAVRDGIDLYPDTPANVFPELAANVARQTKKGEQVHSLVRSGLYGPNGWARVLAARDGKTYWTFLADPKKGTPVTNWSQTPV